MSKALVEYVIKRFNSLEEKRRPWEPVWDKAAELCSVNSKIYIKDAKDRIIQRRWNLQFRQTAWNEGDVDRGALEQAMYKSKLETIEQFVDDVFNSKDTSARYFTTISNSGVAFDLPRDTVLHDKKHNLSSGEWKEVTENIDNFESVSWSDKSIYNGQSVLLKVKAPSGKYGVVFEHMPKGRNIITTAFKDTDANIDNWIKINSARAMQKASTTQKGLLSSRSITDIISNLDSNVNSLLRQNTLFQESLNIAKSNRGTFNPEDDRIYYQGGEEKPYSNRALERLLENPTENKEAILDVYENYLDMYNDILASRVRTVATDDLGAKYKSTNRERLDLLREQRNAELSNLKLPKIITTQQLEKVLKDNDIIIKNTYTANTGSQYVTVVDPRDDEEVIRISIRDHFNHTADRSQADTDFDLMVDRNNNWQDTFEVLADRLGLKGGFVTKVKKYNELKGDNIIQKFYQDKSNPQGPRGAYQNSIIYLFENADASTVIHELGHFFLDDMQKFADNETTKAQLEAIYKYVGSTDGKLTPEQHEYFANSFELYLLEGRAPNKTLEKVFFNFRKWISRIWSEIKRLSGINLTPEIRKVFDEMLGGRGLDFAMQMSGARMAEALERGNISQWQINRAMQVVYEGKASKKDMSDLIKELRNGMKVDEFIAKIREYEKKPANTNRQELREWDYMMLRSQLESLSFRKDKVKARIERLLKWTEPRSQNGKLVGRFPSKELNDAFEHYRTLANMDKNEAKEKRKKNIKDIETQMMSGGEYDIEQLKLENRLLGYAIGDIESKELVKLYDALSESYNLGRLSSNVTGEVKRKRRERLVEDAKDVLTNGFSLTDKINPNIERSKLKQFFARWGVSQQAWSGLLDILSMNDKTSRTGQSKLSRDLDIFEAEQEKYRGIAVDSDSISSKLERALSGSANPAQSVNRYINNELDKEVRIEWVGVSNPKENNPKNQKPLLFSKTFTKDKLIDIWMKAQDKETLEIMHKDPVNQYNKEFLQKVEDELTDDDIAVAKALFDFYDENYTKFNAFYEEHFAVSLPKSRYYSPRSMIVDGVAIDDGSNRGYAGFSGAKERTAKPGSAVVNIKGAFRVLSDYVNKQNHFMAYADKMIDINAVLANREVKSIISSLFGDEMNSIIKNNIEYLANNGNDKIDLWGKRWNRARARFAKSVLAVKPALAIKQLTSFPAYWENVSTGDFVLGVLDFFAHPKEAIETLGNTTLMKTRDVNIIRDFEQMSKSDLFKKIKKVPGKIRWNDFMMWNIKFGDRGAIYMGGWALYKAELKKNLAKGLSEEKAKALALEKFERTTDETQQSGRISQQSSMQQNSATRVFTMFQSSQNQYLRKEINAIRGLVTGRMNLKQAAKTIFIYHVLLPCFFQVVSDGFRFNKGNLLRASVLGSLSGWFILNKVLEGIWSLLFEDEKWGNSRLMVRSFVPSVGSFEDMINAVMDIAEDDIELEDVLDIVKPLGEITGLPLKYALDVYKNAGNYAEEGEYGKEAMLWTGWSPYALRDFEEE